MTKVITTELSKKLSGKLTCKCGETVFEMTRRAYGQWKNLITVQADTGIVNIEKIDISSLSLSVYPATAICTKCHKKIKIKRCSNGKNITR